jgi:hypothetical protein
MPHVLDDTDILEHPSPSLAGDTFHALPLQLPTARCGRSRFLLLLRRLFTPMPRLQTRRQECCVSRAPRFETSLDMLARDYPDIHLRVMEVLG